jgi:hypothetical protein
MFSSNANFSRCRWVLPPLLLLAVVGAIRPLEARLVPRTGALSPTLAGSGGMLVVLDGMRPVLAGGFWLRANLAWERRDAAATMALLHLTVAADERPLYFWLNGARIVAYDLPEWRSEGVPAAVRERTRIEQAQFALSFLQRGMEARGPSSDIAIEMANIRLRALGDRAGAAVLFRQAAELPGAPWYAARIHAELLRELGRPVEALAWLRQILPDLPAEDPAAQRAVVLERIKGLEQEVGGK